MQKPRDIVDYVRNFTFWVKMKLRAKRGTIRKMTEKELENFLNGVLYTFGIPFVWRKFLLSLKHENGALCAWGGCKFNNTREGEAENVVVISRDRHDEYKFILFQLVNNKLSISDIWSESKNIMFFNRI